MKLFSILTLAFILAGCSSGSDSTAANPNTTTPTAALTLQCDLTASYTPVNSPLTSSAASTSAATVIAVHGKNGAPTRSHMLSLAADLNAQGYDVTMPYMPWSDLVWDGTLCDGISYINSLIAAEKAIGNSVILLGHSLAGPIVLSYSALTNTTQPDALLVLAPGHFIHHSINLAGLHASSIQLAKSMVAAGTGDNMATFQTSNGGVLIDISTTANIYLSFHDTEQFPDIKDSIPLVSIPALWLAGLSDPLTASAKTLGIIAAIPANSLYTYKEIAGDHFTLVDNVAAELEPWFQGL